MTNHKFEPGQLVLARYNVGGGVTWSLQHFSHLTSGKCPFNSITGYSFAQCIPYTPETAHLLGTSQPYEPPKPPVEYEWGQKVEVLQNGEWVAAIYVGGYLSTLFDGIGATVVRKEAAHTYNYPPDRIRPLEPSDE